MARKTFEHFRIVLASPGDVVKERGIVVSVAEKINAFYKNKDIRIHLDIARWEIDVGLGLHELGPQGKVDEDLRPPDCDALIGVFWKRFGEKTVDGASPTEHEIRLAIESWRNTGKPLVCMFFRKGGQPPGSQPEAAQLSDVLGFRDECRSLGIHCEYAQDLEFQQAVFDQLLRMTLPASLEKGTEPSPSTPQTREPGSPATAAPASLARPVQVPESPELKLEAHPKSLRACGVAELLGDLVLRIGGCDAKIKYDVYVYSQPSINFTSRLHKAGAGTINITHVQLLRRTGRNESLVTSGRYGANNCLVFEGVDVEPDGDDSHAEFRLTGIRVNASQLGVHRGQSLPVQVFVSIRNPRTPEPVIFGTATLGSAMQSYSFGLSWPMGKGILRLSQLPEYGALAEAGKSDAHCIVSIGEQFGGVFKALSEEADGASNGTRIMLRFSSVPNLIRLFVTKTDLSPGIPQCVLVEADPNGAGGTIREQNEKSIIETVSGVPLVEVSIVGCTAQAVWEWTSAENSAELRSARIAVVVARVSEFVSTGPMCVNLNLCPISVSPCASSSGPIPRFVDTATNRTALTLRNDGTRLLFPFASNQGGFDTGFSVSNASGVVLQTLPQVGACRVRFFGTVGTSRCEEEHPSPSIAPGEQFTWCLSRGGAVAAMPGFQGYVLVECDFPARGFGWIFREGDEAQPGSGFHAEILPSQD